MNDDARGVLAVAAAAALVGLLALGRPSPVPLPAPKPAAIVKPIATKPIVNKPGVAETKTRPVPARARKNVQKRAQPRSTQQRKAQPRNALPSCDEVRRIADSLTWSQKMQAMASATPEQIAHGRRCLSARQ